MADVTLERPAIPAAVPARIKASRWLNPLLMARDPFVYLRRLNRTYGDIVNLNGGIMDYTFVFSPEYTRRVLTNPDLFHNGEIEDYRLNLPKDSPVLRLAHTLNAINGEKHRTQRRLMMPAFHRKRVEAYRDDMASLTRQKMDSWQPGQTYDMMREMKQLTMSVAVKALLGMDPDREGDRTRALVERWIASGSSLAALVLPLNFPGTPFYRMVSLAGQIEAEFKELIARKRASGVDRGDVLSMLIAAHDENGERLNDEELVAQTLALFVAGHETTATALAWTLFLLSQHPRVMSDLVDELEGKLHGDFPTVEQVNELPLLDRVIKESMRVLSPFLWGLRITTEPCEIGPYSLPRSRTVGFAPAIIHHNPDFYPEPERFLPRRWETIDPSPYEYLPFASGPRMCIGATFALMEMKIILPAMLQRYRLTLAPGAKIDRVGFLLAQPARGLPMQVNRQDHNFVFNPARGNIHAAVKLPK
ncbi:MAG TPA: cytochrome P450 [Chloroflexia bacterium]|nr:cytochrome P450 [Chloroflexia bacterium]